MTRLSRENFLITGFVCILFGASMSVAGLGPMAVTVGLFGIVFFLVGMTLGQPDGERLPEAGRFMYRVDVTLDEPIRTSILCGVCGHVEVLDGSRPSAFTCPSCSTSLWDEEE